MSKESTLAVIVRLVRWARANPEDQNAKDALRIVGDYWDATGEGAYVVGAPHDKPEDCPTYYDGCNCTIEMLNDLLRKPNEQSAYDLPKMKAGTTK